MIYAYYAFLTDQKACPKKVNECGLASGFVDECLVWSCQDKPQNRNAPDPKNEARKCYMKRALGLNLKWPPGLNLEPDFSQLPDPSWFGIEVGFELLSPWYSKDDRPFHVLDNPVRKDRVFGMPFMSAASWKGLLRWACRMQAELFEHLEKHDMKLDGWTDPPWIVHLFGNERDESGEFSQGALRFFPTWFDRVGFEVINPHKRKTRAGTQPIYYEVVPAGTKGKLQLLYAPLPGQAERLQVNPFEAIEKLIDSLRELLEKYGISAKRTAGWGAAKAGAFTLFFAEGSWIDKLVGSGCKTKEYTPPKDNFKTLMDENGYPIKILQDENGTLLSKTRWKRLGDKKPHSCTNADFEKFKAWYKTHGEEYRRRMNVGKEDVQLPRIKKLPVNTLTEFKTLIGELKDARKGGA